MAANSSHTQLLPEIQQLLAPLGFILDEEQPHVSGERALLSTRKVVLMGKDKHGNKVIIKASRDKEKIKEILQEKHARDVLANITFAGDELLQAKEVYAGKLGAYYILITDYIPQDKIFVDHTLEEQFFLTLRAFEAQEAHHATTFEHNRQVKKVFEFYTPDTYLSTFKTFLKNVDKDAQVEGAHALMEHAYAFLKEHKVVLERYGNYLSHTDFVPHNMRVQKRALYMLDLASVHFGNKYEGWARFLNYMLIHNPALEKLLTEYLKGKRPEEYLALKLMRIYKIGFLISYYAELLTKTTDDLHTLTKTRLLFWLNALDALLTDREISEEAVLAYKEKRNSLRSEEEAKRQSEFSRA